MDLRWAGTEITIARDEKSANDEGECAHSVSADVMITSGGDLEMAPGAFLQATYQGPKPSSLLVPVGGLGRATDDQVRG